jgi:hypothetical protein
MDLLLEEPKFEDDADLPNEELELSEQLVTSTESALKTLRDMSARIKAAGSIDRTTANTIHTLTTGMESMDNHFAKHPVNSYTAISGQTNLKVTVEGIVGAIGNAVWSAIKAVWKFICDSFKSLFGMRARNGESFIKVQDAVKNKPVTGNTELTDEKKKIISSKVNTDPMAVWLGTGEGMSTKCTPANYGEQLFALEEELISSMGMNLHKFEDALTGRLEIATDTIARILGEDLQGTAGLETLLGTNVKIPHQGASAVLDILVREAAGAVNPSSKLKITENEVIDWCSSIAKNASVMTKKFALPGDVVTKLDKMIKSVQDKVFSAIASKEYNNDQFAQKALTDLSSEVSKYANIMTKYESLKTRYYKGASLALIVASTVW